jgi:hypothetical protein
MLLIILLIGLGGLVYWQFGDQLLDFLNSSTGNGNGNGNPPVVDVTEPAITFPNQPTVLATSASIVWETDEPSSSQVEYGINTTYGSVAPAQPADDPSSGTSLGVVTHSVVLTGLQPNQTYHYIVKSKDAAGNEAISDDKTFMTTEAEGS